VAFRVHTEPHQEVVRLDIAVEEALRIDVLDSRDSLVDDEQDGFMRKLSAAVVEQVLERRPEASMTSAWNSHSSLNHRTRGIPTPPFSASYVSIVTVCPNPGTSFSTFVTCHVVVDVSAGWLYAVDWDVAWPTLLSAELGDGCSHVERNRGQGCKQSSASWRRWEWHAAGHLWPHGSKRLSQTVGEREEEDSARRSFSRAFSPMTTERFAQTTRRIRITCPVSSSAKPGRVPRKSAALRGSGLQVPVPCPAERVVCVGWAMV
jgi:hypothetical protein